MAMKKDFENYLRTRWPKRQVDHGDWATCVVGEFANAVKRPVKEVVDILWHIYGVGTQSIDKGPMVELYPSIKRVPGKSLIDKLNEKTGKSTYADVVAMLG